MKILMEYKDNSVFIAMVELDDWEDDNYMVVHNPSDAIDEHDVGQKNFINEEDAKLAFIESVEAHLQGVREYHGGIFQNW